MNSIELADYWERSGEEDYKTARYLRAGSRNTHCLFFGHLAVEKLLKAIYAKKNPDAPLAIKTHNLLALAEKCEIDLTDGQVEKLQVITQFNISARYDDFKQSFSSKCSDDWTDAQMRNIDEARAWLKDLLTKT